MASIPLSYIAIQYPGDGASLMARLPSASEICYDEFYIVQRTRYIYLSCYVVGDSIC